MRIIHEEVIKIYENKDSRAPLFHFVRERGAGIFFVSTRFNFVLQAKSFLERCHLFVALAIACLLQSREEATINFDKVLVLKN
jgi:hypothetical protein